MTTDCVPAFKACTQSPNAEIRYLFDGSRTATDSGRDDHQLPSNPAPSGGLRSRRSDSSPGPIHSDDCFRLVGNAPCPLTDEQKLVRALVQLGWYWKEPGVLARPWGNRVKSFMNQEGE
jgi:hypothetical protein